MAQDQAVHQNHSLPHCSLSSGDGHPVKPADIESCLAHLYASLEMGGGTFSRSVATNVVVPTYGRRSHQEIHHTIDELAEVHSSRMFLVVHDDSLLETSIEVSARCVEMAKGEHSCSELIEIASPGKEFSSVASIIRSNIISGMPIELAIFDPEVSADAIRLIGPLTDLILTDTALFPARLDLITLLRRLSGQIIDMQWLRLSPWRSIVRAIFDRGGIVDALPTLLRIEIEGGAPDSVDGAALFAGWIVDRLGARVKGAGNYKKGKSGVAVSSTFRDSFELCRAPGERSTNEPAPLGRILFSFEQGSVDIRRVGRTIEATAHFKDTVRISAPIEDENRDALLRRFFLIGESTANYRGSLDAALLLHREFRQ